MPGMKKPRDILQGKVTLADESGMICRVIVKDAIDTAAHNYIENAVVDLRVPLCSMRRELR